MEYCIGVDLGGTNIAVGIVDLRTRQIVKKARIKTHAPRSCEEISSDIVELCRSLCSKTGIPFKSIKWIGIATPGIVRSGVVVWAGNLGWRNAEIVAEVRRLSGIKTFAANDAKAAAYAEAICGVGKGYSSLVVVTLGTGVGGGMVVGGKSWDGVNGFAGEIGHVVLDMNGRECSCGKHGCFEAYCSAPALVKETRRVMQLHPESVLWDMCEGDINRVNSVMPFRALESGDRASAIVINDFVEYLAVGISNIVNMLQPDIICIGGGISTEGDKFIDSLRDRVDKLSFAPEGEKTRIEIAKYMNDAGIIGGALLGIKEKFQ